MTIEELNNQITQLKARAYDLLAQQQFDARQFELRQQESNKNLQDVNDQIKQCSEEVQRLRALPVTPVPNNVPTEL